MDSPLLSSSLTVGILPSLASQPFLSLSILPCIWLKTPSVLPLGQQNSHTLPPQQPPYGGGGYNAPPPPPQSAYPQQATYGAPPPNQYGAPPPTNQYSSPAAPPMGGPGGYGAPAPYQPTMGGPLVFLGTEISPIEGMSMGQPLNAPMGM